MIRKVLLSVLVVSALAWNGTIERSGRTEEKKAESAPYVHTVIFSLQDDAPKGTIDAVIEDAHKMLTTIPTVRELKMGRPAKQATPEFAAKDYDVGLVVFFDDFAGLEKYLKHPQHEAYVNRHLKSFKKVVVYDFVNEKK